MQRRSVQAWDSPCTHWAARAVVLDYIGGGMVMAVERCMHRRVLILALQLVCHRRRRTSQCSHLRVSPQGRYPGGCPVWRARLMELK